MFIIYSIFFLIVMFVINDSYSGFVDLEEVSEQMSNS